MSTKGVYETKLKNGKPSYRASLTTGSRHVSLGSFAVEKDAAKAYEQGRRILEDKSLKIDKLEKIAAKYKLSFQKIVLLMNLRDNGIYIPSPIYVYNRYFCYYLSSSEYLTFDREDLFYYASRRIMRRGGHLFVAEYGMQTSVISRYGIRPFAVKGRDYRFINGDDTDFRYSNIEIINPYHGVLRMGDFGQYRYKALLHIKGNHIIGIYDTPEEAAIAYNKAVDLAKKAGITKDYPVNYLENVPPYAYAEIYDGTKVSSKLLSYFASLTASDNPQSL
ncbi:MAG: hypothetical protein K6E84_04430 [Lachnospiraceae bacterium]|nr:hypothetical protein [Lachnospiraceae bacterium]